MGGRYVPSLLAAIGGVIERHMVEIGLLPQPSRVAGGRATVTMTATVPIPQCPKCGSAALVHQAGCDLCTADRKSVVRGRSVSVRVYRGRRRIIKKKKERK